MKRPISIYFIAAWCFVAMTLQSSFVGRWIASLVSDEQPTEDFRHTVSGVIMVLVIWHVVRLVQLKSVNRWLTVVFFGWWTVAMIWNGFVLLPRLENPRRAALVMVTMGAFNIVSVWQLSRRSFREFAVQFVAERENEKHSRMMQKIAQENVRRGL